MAERIDLSGRDTSKIKKAVFLDRDGVVDEKPETAHYVTRIDELEMLPEIYNLLKLINPDEYIIIVATNQRGIARGLYTYDDLLEISHEMNRKLNENTGRQVDYLYFCPHHQGDPDCNCRKPLAGMFLAAMDNHNLDPKLCIMIGDTDHDSEAAQKAGITNIIQIETDHPEQAIKPLKSFINEH